MKPEDPRRPSGQMLPQSVETNGYFTRLRDSQEWRAIGLVLRRSTERPQVLKLESLSGAAWENPFGDGRSSERIADDLLQRMRTGGFARHRREDYHLDVDYSYRGDGQY